MMPARRSVSLFSRLALVAGAALAAPVLCARPASPADPPPPQQTPEPDESVLGTVEVNGSAGGLPPLPKMAIVPVYPVGLADSVVSLVVHHDMELSGQFEVLPDDKAPPGPFTHDSALDLSAFKGEGAEYVVRVFADPAPGDSAKTVLIGEAFVPPAAKPPADAPAAKPAFRGVVPTATTEVRAAAHRLVDMLLGALTGRPGGFASDMTYAEKVGRWRRVYAIDADGFDLRSVGPSDATAISPAFGPGNQIFYALSKDYASFRLVYGPNATPVPITIPGSIMGLAFSSDRNRLAIVSMDEGKSSLWLGDHGALSPMQTPPFANHPVFGPMGKVAYVAGSPVQRVYLQGKPVSPAGFMASAPVFCDTPQGLLLIYTVGVGAGADIIATDTSGAGVRRLTQHEGANTYAACSPDGRLVAFFSTGKRGQGAGLFVAPILRPWLAKKISNEVGESLRWEALPQVAPAAAATK
jgi:TolB protein